MTTTQAAYPAYVVPTGRWRMGASDAVLDGNAATQNIGVSGTSYAIVGDLINLDLVAGMSCTIDWLKFLPYITGDSTVDGMWLEIFSCPNTTTPAGTFTSTRVAISANLLASALTASDSKKVLTKTNFSLAFTTEAAKRYYAHLILHKTGTGYGGFYEVDAAKLVGLEGSTILRYNGATPPATWSNTDRWTNRSNEPMFAIKMTATADQVQAASSVGTMSAKKTRRVWRRLDGPSNMRFSSIQPKTSLGFCSISGVTQIVAGEAPLTVVEFGAYADSGVYLYNGAQAAVASSAAAAADFWDLIFSNRFDGEEAEPNYEIFGKNTTASKGGGLAGLLDLNWMSIGHCSASGYQSDMSDTGFDYVQFNGLTSWFAGTFDVGVNVVVVTGDSQAGRLVSDATLPLGAAFAHPIIAVSNALGGIWASFTYADHSSVVGLVCTTCTTNPERGHHIGYLRDAIHVVGPAGTNGSARMTLGEDDSLSFSQRCYFAEVAGGLMAAVGLVGSMIYNGSLPADPIIILVGTPPFYQASEAIQAAYNKLEDWHVTTASDLLLRYVSMKDIVEPLGDEGFDVDHLHISSAAAQAINAAIAAALTACIAPSYSQVPLGSLVTPPMTAIRR